MARNAVRGALIIFEMRSHQVLPPTAEYSIRRTIIRPPLYCRVLRQALRFTLSFFLKRSNARTTPKKESAMPAKKKVLLAEDHQMLREGLRAILSQRENLEIVGEAVDGIEALRCVKRLRPDLLLLDLSMPRMNGLSVLLEARAYHPEIKILVLTIHQSEPYVLETFEAGADGYCSKNDSREELLVAIDSVLADKIYLSPLIARDVLHGFLAKRAKRRPDTAWDTVTQREREILKLLAEGYTNREIADMLFISVKTVEKHRSNIMAKLDLHNVAHLTTLAIEKGLVENLR